MKKIISFVINTHNEENNIKECLESVSWADEIIIVDAYSTDQTIKIAKDFTNNIFYHKSTGYVETSRNFGISKAKNQWVFILDADERLPLASKKIIFELIQIKNKNGFCIPRRNYISINKYLKFGYFYPDWQLRLFRNYYKNRYSGIIHQQIEIFPRRIQKCSKFEIIHNYSRSKYSSFLSLNRLIPYILIESKDLSIENDRIIDLLLTAVLNLPRHFIRSFLYLRGYQDGYIGFRAAIIFGIYQSLIYFYAVYLLIINKYHLV